jgi:UDP-N-acetylglucosamine 1-carboxyvinyltransferase
VSEDRDLLLSQIGLRVSKRRQELGLSQRELGDMLGTPQGNISRIEYGQQNLTIDTLCKLANALDTTVAELISGTSGSPSPR